MVTGHPWLLCSQSSQPPVTGLGGLSSATTEAHIILCWSNGATSSRTPTVSHSLQLPDWPRTDTQHCLSASLHQTPDFQKHSASLRKRSWEEQMQTAEWLSWKRAPCGEVSGDSPRSFFFLPAAQIFPLSLKWGCWPLHRLLRATLMLHIAVGRGTDP